MNDKTGIHDRENALFEQYKAQLEPHQDFSEDGLHYLGDFFYNNKCKCWGRDIGNEEELWNIFCRKGRGLVIITKDLNDTTAWDIREEHGRVLIEQLKIYQDASIYIDCSRKYGIGLLKEIYQDIIPYGIGNDEWIYYSAKQRFIIINSYHPAYRFYGGEKAYYNRMRDAVKKFFDNYPDFLTFQKKEFNCMP